MNSGLRETIFDGFRRTALPLASYYAVTLVVPLANGAAGARFLRHALVVLVVPPLVITLTCAVRQLVHSLVDSGRQFLFRS